MSALSPDGELGTPTKEPAHHRVADRAGWYGMAAIVTAYLLVSVDVLASSSSVYQLLNLTGAIGLMWVSWVKGVTQGVILNVFWVSIAVIGLTS